jgi:hypothetical protein
MTLAMPFIAVGVRNTQVRRAYQYGPRYAAA